MQNIPTTPAHPAISSAERILAAAETLFAEQGFDAVSMNSIALKAGVSKANIFHHFNSKNALYLAVVQSVCNESAERLERFESGAGNFVERLSAFAANHLQSILGHDQAARLILRDMLEKGPDHSRALAEQVFGRNFSRLVEIIRSGQARHELREDADPAAVAIILIAANIYFFQAHDLLRYFPDVDFADSPQRYSQKIMQMLLDGLRPHSGGTV